jgi:pyridoxal phosphate enzyme (YggS family)
MEANIESNIRYVQDRMAASAAAAGRAYEDVSLLAISKTFPVDAISQAVAAGLNKFGENRVQEAENKIPRFRENTELEWHLVGHLQSNKSRLAAELFDVIHSIDSIRLAEKLNEACLNIGKKLSLFLQVDLGKEKTKFGIDPDRLPEIIEAVSRFERLRLDGLMTLPPYYEDPEKTRPYFVRLRNLRDALETSRPGCLGRQQLSMGMSHDFEVAIQEGSTIVRIGTSIFGLRQ